MAAKTVVFVQGGKKNEAAYPWMFFHLHPTSEPAPEAVDLVFFDYPTGTVKTWKNHILERGKAPTAAPDSETAMTHMVKLRKGDGTTDDTGPDRGSVISMYEWVKTQPKQSIRSLQVFSHGWQGGPILWNTPEFNAAGSRMDPLSDEDRDPNDTDFRLRDFVGSNPLAGAEGIRFADAFSSDALIKLWGCVAPTGVRPQMQRYIAVPRGSDGDATRKAHLSDYLDSIGDSYPMHMASKLNLPVWAAPLGYGSEPGGTVPITGGEMNVAYRGKFPPDLKKDRWWRVSWFFRHQDRGAKFYTDVLKAAIDTTDFIEHRKSWFEDARRAANPGPPSPITSPFELQKRITDLIDALGRPTAGAP